jgi:hypothetical protein
MDMRSIASTHWCILRPCGNCMLMKSNLIWFDRTNVAKASTSRRLALIISARTNRFSSSLNEGLILAMFGQPQHWW